MRDHSLPDPDNNAVVPATLWHVNKVQYETGTLIPATWGPLVLAQGSAHPFWEREQRLERTRAAMYPSSPSRLSCTFAWDNIGDALWYAERGNHLYEVIPNDPSTPIDQLDILWLTWMGEPGTETDRDLWSSRYWQRECTKAYKVDATPRWELLVIGSLRVIREVSLSGMQVTDPLK
jgi:hypothetical protein